MANDLPDAMRLREVKYGSRSNPKEQIRVARLLSDAGRIAEALDLFLLAGDTDAVGTIRARAVEEGRPLLLLMIRRAGASAPSPEEWKRAGDAAVADERWREAFRCYTEANDEAGLARVRERLPDYDIYRPPGK